MVCTLPLKRQTFTTALAAVAGEFVTADAAELALAQGVMRVEQPDPYLSEYFQWLADLIKKRMKECPRKPFHESGK